MASKAAKKKHVPEKQRSPASRATSILFDSRLVSYSIEEQRAMLAYLIRFRTRKGGARAKLRFLKQRENREEVQLLLRHIKGLKGMSEQDREFSLDILEYELRAKWCDAFIDRNMGLEERALLPRRHRFYFDRLLKRRTRFGE